MRLCELLKKKILIGLIFFGSTLAYAGTHSPVGTWKTIDDNTNKPRSIVSIWEEDGKLYGKVKDIFYQPGEKKTERCEVCPDKWHNQKKIGMTILWDFVKSDDNPFQWVDGHILDPKTGSIYKCQMTLDDTGQALEVRGYIGMPLLGRTQKWERVTDNEAE